MNSLQETKETHFYEYIHKAIDGHKESFCYLIRFYEKDLNAVAMCILKNEDNAADAISETILKAFKNIQTLKNPQVFKSWLLKILVNECNSFLRKNSKFKFADEEEFKLIEFNDKYENLDIKDALERLSAKHKIIVELYYYRDMSIEDISKVLEISMGTVKSRLSRARTNLYHMLKED